jgi:hypothetical protein
LYHRRIELRTKVSPKTYRCVTFVHKMALGLCFINTLFSMVSVLPNAVQIKIWSKLDHGAGQCWCRRQRPCRHHSPVAIHHRSSAVPVSSDRRCSVAPLHSLGCARVEILPPVFGFDESSSSSFFGSIF